MSTDDMQSNKTLLVVLDTNQWQAQYGLRSRLGAALFYFLGQHRGRLGLPEVIETEVVKHLVAEGRKAVEQVDAQLRILHKLTASMPSIALPNQEQLEQATLARLAELNGILMRAPLDADEARRALARVNDGRSPNRKKEQFKDSLLWESCRTFAVEYDVHLVSADAAFFESGYSSIAADLQAECKNEGLSIRIHRDVAHLLAHLRESAPELDYERLGMLLFEGVRASLDQHCAESGFAVNELTESSVQAFATEELDRLALTFRLEGSLTDRELSESGNDRQGRFDVTGEAVYNISSGRVDAATPTRIQSSYRGDDGTESKAIGVFVSSALHLGSQPPEPLRIRAPISAAPEG